MHTEQIALAVINVIGGILVIASYVYGLVTQPDFREGLWGYLPERIKPFYTISMLLAAAGYFAFTYLILFVLEPDEVRIANTFDFKLFLVLYALILFPSALWMPLTFKVLKNPGIAMWRTIRITLAVVGIGSFGLLLTILDLRDSGSSYAYWLAVAGAAAFCVQTALLDALVWPRYFRDDRNLQTKLADN